MLTFVSCTRKTSTDFSTIDCILICESNSSFNFQIIVLLQGSRIDREAKGSDKVIYFIDYDC